MSPGPEYLRLGTVTRSHGLRGQVVVDALPGAWPLPEGVRSVWVFREEEEPRRFTLERAQEIGRSLVLRLAELARREDSDRLRGAELWLERAEIQVSADELATDDMLGLGVFLEDGSPLGRLEDIWSTGANDVYVVRGPRGEWLLPAIDQVVLGIDLEARRVTVRLLPGLEPTPGGAPRDVGNA
ncbi:MAG: 16S rRNA processing protein RimM [Candidatus Eisenbacteria bacterium]|nr:16S rRNA processing protein RimM [Candidatus Eisenbacteria bacterium]